MGNSVATTRGWDGATVVVTGGGSGIGRALSLALARRGARVSVTDIDGASALRVAKECGSPATGAALDVRDARHVQEIVEATFARDGRLDYLFNNAGIAIGGETEDISLATWDRIIDINLRGIVHGVAAAYPIMIRQGFGHIVNTASLAGLGPAPLLTPYATTKFAIVGLSTSLRIEAAAHGVQVSVLCPSAIETPILDSKGPDDLPRPRKELNARRYLTRISGRPYPPEKMAEDALRAIERNEAVIVIPTRARLTWRLSRFFPGLLSVIIARFVKAEREAG